MTLIHSPGTSGAGVSTAITWVSGNHGVVETNGFFEKRKPRERKREIGYTNMIHLGHAYNGKWYTSTFYTCIQVYSISVYLYI